MVMGRIFFLSIIFFLTSAGIVSANTITHELSVTATVLPSSEWISLVQTHSVIRRISLPLVNLVIYQLLLTDGNIFIKNHSVTMTASAPNQVLTQTLSTNQTGIVQFILPDNLSLAGQPDFNFNFSP
jgi:hypothetical protein